MRVKYPDIFYSLPWWPTLIHILPKPATATEEKAIVHIIIISMHFCVVVVVRVTKSKQARKEVDPFE